MKNILWCSQSSLTGLVKLMFPDCELFPLSEVDPNLQEQINDCCFAVETTSCYVDTVADLYTKLSQLSKHYDGVVLPDDSAFLSHFFYHAGIETYSDKKEFSCYVMKTQHKPHQITVLV